MAYHAPAMPNPDGHDERRPAVKDALETQLQHVERQAKFANDMVTALREEFAMLWAMPGRRGQIEGAEAFVAQVDALAALAGRYLEDLGRARGMPALQAQRLVRMLDVNKLLERGRGVEGVARALRTLPAIKAAKPTGNVPPRPSGPPGRPGAPAAPAPAPAAAPKKLTERLADMLDRYVVTEVVPQAAAAPPPPISPAERRLRMFEAAVGLVTDVLADAGPRLAALRVAVAASDGSVDPWAAARQAGVPADLR